MNKTFLLFNQQQIAQMSIRFIIFNTFKQVGLQSSESSSMKLNFYFKCLFLLLLCLQSIVTQLNFNQRPLRPKQNVIKLGQYQTMSLSIIQPLKIDLKINKTDIKPHSLSYMVNQEINEKLDTQIYSDWNISITIRTIEGEVAYYFAPKNGFSAYNTSGNLKSQLQIFQSSNFVRDYLQLKQGVNNMKSSRLKPYLEQEIEGIKIFQGGFCIIVIPKKESKFIIKYGNPDHQILPLKINQQLKVYESRNDIQYKIYRLALKQDSFSIKFTRKRGYPFIKIYQCQPNNPDCFKQVNLIPEKLLDDDQKMKNNRLKSKRQKQVKFMIESMLAKTQEYVGTKCKQCELYLSVQVKQQTQAEVDVALMPSNYVLKLKQNEILKEDLRQNAYKKYQISIKQSEPLKINIQVYEGSINAVIKSLEGDWSYSPIQSTGVISISFPISQKSISKQKNDTIYILQIKALQQDATYSLVYSSGEYEIFIKDGYPTTHLLNPKQTISFVYHNEQLTQNPMYMSFNLNDSKAINNLTINIYYFVEQDQKLTKYQYRPSKSIEQLAKQAKSIVMEIPGQYPQLEISFLSSWSAPIQIAVTINDEQIIFLPLEQSLPLQIDKNGGVNLLVDNNEEGYIELIIKKCDESYPKIAYSLSPQDFTNQIYDYESLQENQRISKNHIKVKKGGGLYIRISGDGITNSFIQISARYMQKNRKNIMDSNPMKKGNYGEINYQLITNSKAEVWFQEIQCSKECQNNTKYYCYWSTSKSDLIRHMVCPGVFMFKSSAEQTIKTESYEIKAKPERDGIVAIKHVLTDPIIYMSVKAVSEKLDEVIYKNIQIVNISGQIGRMSRQFLFVILGTVIVAIVLLFFVIKKQARMGYSAIKTEKTKKKKKMKQEYNTVI